MDDPAPPRALVKVAARQVQILGDEVTAVQLPDGSIYLVLRALCDLFGLNRAAQVRHIHRDEALTEALIEVRVETSGGEQTLQVLRVESVPYWLSRVQIKRVRTEWQDKLREYKQWVVKAVYEAFQREIGDGGGASGPPSTTLQELLQTRDLLRALLAMNEAHIALEQRQQAIETRMDRASTVVGDLRRRVHALEERLDPAGYITSEQQATVQNAVKALAEVLTAAQGKNQFAGVWSEIHRRWSVPDYKHLRVRDYPAVLAFLDAWHAAVFAGHPAPPA